MDIQQEDFVQLETTGRWYRVRRKPYTYIVSYTTSRKPQYSELCFVGTPYPDDGLGWEKRQLQVSAIAAVWRGDVQVWPPVVKQLSLFEDG
jgi:hypothetical protein